ncbi:hypothetical protein ACFW7O_08235 [Streptomyces diastatochromogenes]|uniref:hypothetical protein n=1 Tax=Streptomyces diastatochromogenes TaxID=42236 RepID=UPI003693065E
MLARNAGLVPSPVTNCWSVCGATTSTCAAMPSTHTFVSYLRRKPEADVAPRLIHTVRGVGFVLRAEP